MILVAAVVAAATALMVHHGPMGRRSANRVTIGGGALALLAAAAAHLTTLLSVPWAATICAAVVLMLPCTVALGVVSRPAPPGGQPALAGGRIDAWVLRRVES